MGDFHWRFLAEVADVTSSRVAIPAYPLVPSGTAETVVPAVADLLAKQIEISSPENVTVMGDSAGGTIALATAVNLRQRNLPRPARTIVISPLLDITLSNPDIAGSQDIQSSLSYLRRIGDVWRGSLDANDPLVSPMNATLENLGHVAVFSGTADFLHPDCERLVAALSQPDIRGTSFEYHPGQELAHCFPLHLTTEGQAARRAIHGMITVSSRTFHLETQHNQ